MRHFWINKKTIINFDQVVSLRVVGGDIVATMTNSNHHMCQVRPASVDTVFKILVRHISRKYWVNSNTVINIDHIVNIAGRRRSILITMIDDQGHIVKCYDRDVDDVMETILSVIRGEIK